jgi:hypothetical protein
MEPQAEYKTKNRPFHGEYTSPGQGKRPEQYNASLMIFTYLVAAAFGLFFFIGLYTFGTWIWTLFTGGA